MSEYTEKDIKRSIHPDTIRFSQFHMWYKTLPFEGRDFLMFPFRGFQPRNDFAKRENQDEIHWWFLETEYIDELPISGFKKEFIMTHPVTFNCFLRGTESIHDSPVLKGTIEIELNNPGIIKKLRAKYPTVKKDIKHSPTHDEFAKYAELEHEAQIARAVKIGKKIHKYMQDHHEYDLWITRDRNNMDTSTSETSESSTLEKPKITRKKSFMNISPERKKKGKKSKKTKKKFGFIKPNKSPPKTK